MTDAFMDNLIETNRSHLFYVDWEKATKNRDTFKDELALLQVLTLENIDPRAELRRLITSHNRINALLPLLIAARIKDKNSVLTVLDDDRITNLKYNFSSKYLSSTDIDNSVAFAEKTGLLKELTTIKNPFDYYFGVEVGMDTNARKNRSGKAMEGMVEEILREIIERHNGRYLSQKTFQYSAKEFKVKTPKYQSNKKGDLMALLNDKPFNIEVNYFDKGGSKQEIMNSYISRAQDLKDAGWGFILVTDGQGWKKNKAQIEQGYERIGNILNLKMCTDGLLEKILTEES